MKKVINKIRFCVLAFITFVAIALNIGTISSFLLDLNGKEIERMLVTQSENVMFPDSYQQARKIYSDRGGIHSLRLLYRSDYPIKEDELIKSLNEIGFQIKRRRVVTTTKYTNDEIVLESNNYACIVTITDEKNFSLTFYYKTPIERIFGARY